MKKHHLEKVIGDVEKTHPGLGGLVAFECLAVKSHKVLLAISPAGCGKSEASKLVGKASHSSIFADRLTTAGLQALTEEFNDFKGVVVVDDIAKTGSVYARIATVTTLAELVYSHFMSSHMSKMQFEITNFYGSAIVNIQPIMLDLLIASPEWEASVQDKAIRYYHLARPVVPCQEAPKTDIKWGGDYDKVTPPDMGLTAIKELVVMARSQWGTARAAKHTGDLLCAAAAIDGRTKVGPSDIRLLKQLMPALRIEQVVIDKMGFESERVLNTERLAVLTEYIAHGPFTIAQVAEDYHLSEATAYKLMAKESADWIITKKNPSRFAPKPALLALMEGIGIIRANGKNPAKGVQGDN